VPLRFICGAADSVAGLTMAERYRVVPKADVVMLDGVGHYPNVEAADRTLRAFLEFRHRL
jgi:pimeloyl-ACP methyl ester carboxylesterase